MFPRGCVILWQHTVMLELDGCAVPNQVWCLPSLTKRQSMRRTRPPIITFNLASVLLQIKFVVCLAQRMLIA